MFVIDDLLLGVPFLLAAWHALQKSRDPAVSGSTGLSLPAGTAASPVASGLPSAAEIAACRAAVPASPGLQPTSAMLGGYYYSGHNPAHLAYLQGYLEQQANSTSGEDVRRIRAFEALQSREGGTGAINTYDNQKLTWGSGWGAFGGLGHVMDTLTNDPAVVADLAACGVQYLGAGNWAVVDDSGNLVTDKKAAIDYIHGSLPLLNLLIHLAEDPATRDAVTDAQLHAFQTTSAAIPGSETIYSQALFNLATHLKHWAPGYMVGVVESAGNEVPGAPSLERDKLLATQIVDGFYGLAHGWIPDWKQLQGYVLRDMKVDGLDVSDDPVLTAATSPSGTQTAAGRGMLAKTAAGCGANWGGFKKFAGGPGLAVERPIYQTAGGCGQYNYPNAEVCGSWGPMDQAYLSSGALQAALNANGNALELRTAGGAGAQQPPGFEQAREVFVEPELQRAAQHKVQRAAGGPGSPTAGGATSVGWGETEGTRWASGPGTAPTPDQVATVQRGIATAVLEDSHDDPTYTQIRVGDYDVVVTSEPLSVNGLRLPTSMDDAVAVSGSLGALPITPVVSDACWSDPRVSQVACRPLNDKTGALFNDPGQVVRYNTAIGPNTGTFTDGYWKDLVIVPGLQPSGRGSMAQYGFKNASGSMFEHGGPSNHDRSYKDYSDTPRYMSRRALKDGVPVDLLDELEAGCPLGGPLPAWLVERFRGGASS